MKESDNPATKILKKSFKHSFDFSVFNRNNIRNIASVFKTPRYLISGVDADYSDQTPITDFKTRISPSKCSNSVLDAYIEQI